MKYFEKKELTKFFNILKKKASIRDQALFNIMYWCGLRVSELQLLNIESYNPDAHTIQTNRLKGGISNTIRLDSSRERLIRKYIKTRPDALPYEPLFISREDSPVSRDMIFKLTKKFCVMAKIKKLSPHAFRHSIAVHLLDSDVPIYAVQNLLGHKNISTTTKYLAFTTAQNKLLFDKMIASKNIAK